MLKLDRVRYAQGLALAAVLAASQPAIAGYDLTLSGLTDEDGGVNYDAFLSARPNDNWTLNASVGHTTSSVAFSNFSGTSYGLSANEAGRTCLHGGSTGMATRVWEIADAGPHHLTLRLSLADGDGGFPGNRVCDAAFVLGADADLTLTLRATTDAPTLMNRTTHRFWSLDGRATTAGHSLRVAADHYLAVDGDRIPVGAPQAVAGTRFDLQTGGVPELNAGYDHNWCLAPARRPLSFAAELTGLSGVRLVMETTEPGLQIYDGARMDTAPHLGHSGQPYGANAGIALEAQGWPDAPNRPDFPAVRLDPGQAHEQVTRWRFSRD